MSQQLWFFRNRPPIICYDTDKKKGHNSVNSVYNPISSERSAHHILIFYQNSNSRSKSSKVRRISNLSKGHNSLMFWRICPKFNKVINYSPLQYAKYEHSCSSNITGILFIFLKSNSLLVQGWWAWKKIRTSIFLVYLCMTYQSPSSHVFLVSEVLRTDGLTKEGRMDNQAQTNLPPSTSSKFEAE